MVVLTETQRKKEGLSAKPETETKALKETFPRRKKKKKKTRKENFLL